MMNSPDVTPTPARLPLRLEITCAPGRPYKSIDSLIWEDIPPLAIVTGLNGSGKTQLLEILAFKLTSTLHPRFGGVINEANVFLTGDSFPPESVAYVPSRWEMTSAVHLGIAQMEQAKEQLWNELRQGQTHDIRANVRRSRVLTLVNGDPGDRIKFSQKLPDDYSFMLEDGDVVAGLAHVMVAYRLRVAEELERSTSREDITKKLGPAPWDVINEAFVAADFPYSVVSPIHTSIAGTYKLELVGRLGGENIEPGDLSSGEKMLLALVLWLYNSQHHGRFPKLLLLDEPDAHLHPSMTRQFLTVIKEVLVERYGVRVILTTHSPSTVALSPEGSVFEMSRTAPRMKKSASAAETIGLLTAGLVVVSAGSRFVLVEDTLDVSFYQTIRDILSDYGPSRDMRAIKAAPSIVFLPASNGKGQEKTGGGSSVVKAWVNKFDQPPLSEIVKGVIDNDDENVSTARIAVLKRYSIENYLLDPFVIYCLLSSVNSAPLVAGVEAIAGNEHLIRDLPESSLVALLNTVTAIAEKHIDDLAPAEKLTEPVLFTNGKIVQYPAWILKRRGHDLMPVFQKAFGGPGVINSPKLQHSIRRLRLIPVELAEIFEQLQS